MCEHLLQLENELGEARIKETYRGQPWSQNCREWAYFDCVLDLDKIRERMHLPDFVTSHSNDDPKSGLEAGFVCDHCKDAIIGIHASLANGKIIFT